MTHPMTATPAHAGLDELDALLAAATPGPWRWDPEFGEERDTGLALTNDAGAEIVGAYNYHCCDFRDDPRVGDADAALIVALRNLAPAMLAAIRAAYALAETWDTGGADSRYGENRIARDTAARSLRAVLDEALGASGE